MSMFLECLISFQKKYFLLWKRINFFVFSFYNLCRLLNYYAVTTISNFTYYKYKNMVDAIMESYKSVSFLLYFALSVVISLLKMLWISIQKIFVYLFQSCFILIRISSNYNVDF